MGPLQTLIIITTHSPRETQALGAALGKSAQSGDLLLLCGDLGSGKTCLTQGIARGLKVADAVRSPTFVLATEYTGRLPLYHVDLYRLDDIREVDDLGLDDYIEGEGVCVVEWADKAMPFFPEEHLLVEVEATSNKAFSSNKERTIRITPYGIRYSRLVEQVQRLLAKKMKNEF